MAGVNDYIDQLKAVLPPQIQDFWWLVLVIIGLILLLIIINVPKLFKKKDPHIDAFKQEQLGGQQQAVQQNQQPAPSQQTAPPQQAGLKRPQRPTPPAGIQAAHHDQMMTHNVHEPHNNYKQLDQFIRAQLDANFSEDLIRRNLLTVGWNPLDIDSAIARVNKELQDAASEES